MKYSKTELVLISTILLTMVVWVGKFPVIDGFYSEHKNTFNAFLLAFFLLILISGILYQRTLDCVDDPTPSTIKVSIINIVLWCIFWVTWSIYNVIALMYYPFNSKLLIFSILLTILPGVSFFLFALVSRNSDLALEPDPGATPAEIAVKEELLQYRYYIGFYGILTIPVYLIAYVICYVLK